MKLTPALIKRGAAGLSLLACVACAGSLDDPSRFFADAGEAGATINDASACPDIPAQVFVPFCALSGCHSAADMIQGLDLESTGVAARLVGTCARGGGYLVDPNDPARSVVYAKLTFAPPFGSRMPLGGRPLDTATLACVLAWVSAQSGTLNACGDDGGAPLDAPTESAARDAGGN